MTFASSLIVCAARAFKLRVPIIIFVFIAATYKENLERYSIFANMATAVLTCPLCESLSLTLKAYISHLRLVHAKDSSFRVMCGINGCREIFRAFSAFNSHVYRHHRTALGLGSDETVDQQSGSGSTHEANSQRPRLCQGVYVLLQYDDVRPLFGKIIDIVCIEETVVLCVQEYYGRIFNSHYNCFSITHYGVFRAVHIGTLQDHRPLQARKSFVVTDKSLYIMLPYNY